MQNVVVSIKSRRVAITDDEFFSSCNETESDYGDLLTEDEKCQLELALKIDSSESVPENGISDGFIAHRHSVYLVDGENRKPSPRHKKICFLLEVHFVWRRRVLVTFTKFEELQPLDEFPTPPLSPRAAGNQSPAVMQATVLLFNQAFRLILNHPDSILNSLTREIKEVGQDGKEAAGNEDCPVKLKLVAPPLYALTTQTLDKSWGFLLSILSLSSTYASLKAGWPGSLVKPALFDVVLAVIVVTTSSFCLIA
ncbi:hypothetical protein IFM89_014106 [Coptis chinensis]|uniref:Uncharacterized protein n=1 Tax=Coptis chinensis TaxID=261450 RepID=A0A835HSJ8_9MAGN|nr:hypothetical protein IFM89_014106 [Coptis chinensis]